MNDGYRHCVKSVCIRSFSGPYFPAFGLNTERYEYLFVFSPNGENTDQKNSKYGHFLRSVYWVHAVGVAMKWSLDEKKFLP